AVHEKNWRQARRNIQACINIARHAGERTFVLSQLVSISVYHMAIQELAIALEQHASQLPLETLEAFETILQTRKPEHHTSLADEHLAMLDILQHIYARNGQIT